MLFLASVGYSAEPRVVGYLPDYRARSFDPESAKRLTDLIVFSAEPTTDGTLDLSRLSAMPWEKLRQFKTAQRVRLVLCVGGWERSKGFAPVAASAELRAKFARHAVDVCLKQRLDGIDLDWEHPKDDAEHAHYASLIGELRTAFQPHGLSLSVTMAGWQSLPKAAFGLVDTVNLMAYDHDGPHSTFEGARKDVEKLIARGAPAGKVVLGLPFYGRSIKQREQATTYAELLQKYKPAADVDEVDGIYFNGPGTIRKKTEWALEQKLAGVMVWEIGQDAPGDASLLKLVRETIDKRR